MGADVYPREAEAIPGHFGEAGDHCTGQSGEILVVREFSAAITFTGLRVAEHHVDVRGKVKLTTTKFTHANYEQSLFAADPRPAACRISPALRFAGRASPDW